jgi:carboxymethylenebutenolidase
VLELQGGQDATIPQDTLEQMRAALDQAGEAAKIVVYPDAGHAFHADYRPSYLPAAAQDAWKRMLAWFARYGGA